MGDVRVENGMGVWGQAPVTQSTWDTQQGVKVESIELLEATTIGRQYKTKNVRLR